MAGVFCLLACHPPRGLRCRFILGGAGHFLFHCQQLRLRYGRVVFSARHAGLSAVNHAQKRALCLGRRYEKMLLTHSFLFRCVSQPPPLRGTSFHRKEGASTRAPSLGRGCRAQRGGVGFLFCGEAASSLPSPRGEGKEEADGALAAGKCARECVSSR